ncbi:hypothetical protein EYF80_035729 [Liparis tanakae]|uniref:Uncharacterized protein n=1 Tax=Liparis tanakae TaxID=230148 RepID=A0A4Z2GKD2_9TELE|nr:hypothetical protein EYF80_035729 [Liparis tanakae]
MRKSSRRSRARSPAASRPDATVGLVLPHRAHCQGNRVATPWASRSSVSACSICLSVVELAHWSIRGTSICSRTPERWSERESLRRERGEQRLNSIKDVTEYPPAALILW